MHSKGKEERIVFVTVFYYYLLSHDMGSHMPSLEDLSPFVEGDTLINARSLS